MGNKGNIMCCTTTKSDDESGSQKSEKVSTPKRERNDLKPFMNISQHLSEMNEEMKGNTLLDVLVSPLVVSKLPVNFSGFNHQHRPSIINMKARAHDFPMRPLSSYKIIEVIGEGTYGRVFKAEDSITSRYVALKYIRMSFETEGFPITCMREIKILRQLNHENVVKLLDVVANDKQTYLVFEYMNNDLTGLLHNRAMQFNESNIYQITRQLLNGLQFCHSQNIVHRDMKTSNILVNSKGQVKIADFGLARHWQPDRPFTNKVVSLWYRPIELLLGQEIYDFSADVWSLGCIIVELFQRAPMFPFDTELAMITGIYEICGTPSRNKWDDAQKLKNYIEPIKSKPRMLQFTYEFIPKNALSLIDQMMTLDPKKRINVNNALKSKWILSMEGKKLEPMKLPDCDNFEIKMKKRIKKH